VGGQGVVVLKRIYRVVKPAMPLRGLMLQEAEIHGMAQRGGSIVAYTRIGEKVESPLIETRKSRRYRLVLKSWKLRGHYRCLKKNGTVIVNQKYICSKLARF